MIEILREEWRRDPVGLVVSAVGETLALIFIGAVLMAVLFVGSAGYSG